MAEIALETCNRGTQNAPNEHIQSVRHCRTHGLESRHVHATHQITRTQGPLVVHGQAVRENSSNSHGAKRRPSTSPQHPRGHAPWWQTTACAASAAAYTAFHSEGRPSQMQGVRERMYWVPLPRRLPHRRNQPTHDQRQQCCTPRRHTAETTHHTTVTPRTHRAPPTNNTHTHWQARPMQRTAQQTGADETSTRESSRT